jgi:hypothetical protein
MKILILRDTEAVGENHPVKLEKNQIFECKMITKGIFTSTFELNNQHVCIRNWNWKSE